jgi:hypothetical protein
VQIVTRVPLSLYLGPRLVNVVSLRKRPNLRILMLFNIFLHFRLIEPLPDAIWQSEGMRLELVFLGDTHLLSCTSQKHPPGGRHQLRVARQWVW